jgi:hypothetical protein
VKVAFEILEIGMAMTHRGRAHVVAGISPVGVTPQVVDLRDIEVGCIRTVSVTDESLPCTYPGGGSRALVGGRQRMRMTSRRPRRDILMP